jgi:aminoglycoside phosphotransferase (APT) family kinase protein
MPELKIDKPTTVREGEQLDTAKLSQYLNNEVEHFGQITAIQQFPGGYSNLTYFLKTDTDQEYVLRKPPVGAKNIKGGHDMGREFRVLSTLKNAGYTQIPTPIAFCEDEAIMGCPFYVMERVQGVILRAHSAPKLGLSAQTMRTLSESMADTLVDLHAIDIQSTGLINLGKPEGYIQRQVEGWYKRYQNAQTDDLPAVEKLYEWLVQNMPADGTATLIHNDFKYDNVVLNADDITQIVALLDWEMCTVGDPLMDLGTALSYWSEAGDDAFTKSFNLTWLEGNLTRQEFANRYAERSGRDVSNILYFYVFGLFKNTVVMQQIYARWKKGFTKDERFAGLLVGMKALTNTAIKAIERGGI